MTPVEGTSAIDHWFNPGGAGHYGHTWRCTTCLVITTGPSDVTLTAHMAGCPVYAHIRGDATP